MNSSDWKKLLEESSISQLFLTLIFGLITFVVLLVRGSVPEWLIQIDFTLVGFYFGAKSNSLTNKLADTYKQAAESRGPEPAASGSVTTVVTTALDAPVIPAPYTQTATAPIDGNSATEAKAESKVAAVAAPHIEATSPEEALATAVAGEPAAPDVIEVKDGAALDDVVAGKPVSAVIVDTANIAKAVTP